MFPNYPGGHEAYQDFVVRRMRDHYANPAELPSGLLDIAERFWRKDLTGVNATMRGVYSPFGPRPRPACCTAKLLVDQAVSQLRAASTALAALMNEMQSLAASLPVYPVVMGMFGVGPALGPQLMAEIGDVRRFHSKKATVAFAGIDTPPYQSGQMEVRSRSISKRGSSALRRTLFLVMSTILRRSPADASVFQFMSKKRAEGKPYRVYMMASSNKFLRIYYATVKQYLDSLET